MISWTEFQHRKASSSEIDRWFNVDVPPNIGIVCGSISGIVVPDIDGPEGEVSLHDLRLPRTRTAKTPHGRHLYYRHPGVIPTRTRLLPGMDVRAEGSYVVAPPSVGTDGTYAWEDESGVATLPAEIVQLFMADRRGPNEVPPGKGLSPLLTTVREGERNEAGTRLAGSLLNHDYRPDEAFAVMTLWNKKNEPPLSDEELVGIISSVARTHGRSRATVRPVVDLVAELIPGNEFIEGEPALPPAVWGEGSRTLAIEGEPTLFFGPVGTCKTTMAQNVVIRRLGLATSPLLGLAVPVDNRPVLYVAADRPRQIARSFRRLVIEGGESWRKVLCDRLKILKGPPPFDLRQEPRRLAELAMEVGAGMVVLDSLSNIVMELSKDESGAAYNTAVQFCVAEGVEVLAITHDRKQHANSSNLGIDDVYGSRWITSGAGSVVAIEGEPGDTRLRARHLKQPEDCVGPLSFILRKQTGDLELVEMPDLLAHLRDAGEEGLSATDASRFLYSGISHATTERARRELTSLVDAGLAVRNDRGKAHRWVSAESRESGVLIENTHGVRYAPFTA
jgi:hypothetical protein